MKKILILFFILPFGFSVLPVFAAEATQAGETRESTKSASAQIIYELPYPGLLSDSPIYFIKALRDKVTELLISDPVKKAEFYLLTADKRLNEGVMLFDKGLSKYSLLESTISKGENYFEKGIGQLQLAQKQNIPIASLIQKYHLSSRKHQEVIKDLSGKSSGGDKAGLIQSQKRAEKFEKMLESFGAKQ